MRHTSNTHPTHTCMSTHATHAYPKGLSSFCRTYSTHAMQLQHTSNTRPTYSQHTPNILQTLSKHTLKTPCTNSQHTPNKLPIKKFTSTRAQDTNTHDTHHPRLYTLPTHSQHTIRHYPTHKTHTYTQHINRVSAVKTSTHSQHTDNAQIHMNAHTRCTHISIASRQSKHCCIFHQSASLALCVCTVLVCVLNKPTLVV